MTYIKNIFIKIRDNRMTFYFGMCARTIHKKKFHYLCIIISIIIICVKLNKFIASFNDKIREYKHLNYVTTYDRLFLL